MVHKRRLVLSLCFVLFLLSCSNEVNVDDVPAEQVKEVEVANNELGFSVLSLLESENEKNENIFISPTSLYAALLLVYNGSDGTTKKEFADLLQTEELSDEEANEAMYVLLESIAKDTDDVEVSSANSLWVADDFTLQSDYAETMKQYFAAHIATIDREDDASAEAINQWVREETNDKIEEIIEPPLDPAFVALLVNVLYFNGKWQQAFAEELTEEDTFYGIEDEVDVPFMSLNEELDYMKNEDVEAIKLPYGEGEMDMQIYLPDEEEDMTEFVSTTMPEKWATWQDKFAKRKGMLTLPKFTLEDDIVLNDVLQELGIETAFSAEARFPHLVEESSALAISEVKQKTYIDVDETGTEAAAATSVEIVETSLEIDEEPFTMQVDRPFIFAITDTETDAILFLGKMNNPNE